MVGHQTEVLVWVLEYATKTRLFHSGIWIEPTSNTINNRKEVAVVDLFIAGFSQQTLQTKRLF